ncbi:unnamed protein product [Symbiodinium sp. CCMP2592]|nr:unnamed protein product [Symbiodinium sp. CCMP2592]
MAFPSFLWLDSVGRRVLLSYGLSGVTASYGVAALGLGLHSPTLAGIGLMASQAIYQGAVGPVTWIVSSEMYPSDMRARGCAIAAATFSTFTLLSVRMLQRGAAQFRSWCGWGKPYGVSFPSHLCGHGPRNSRADTQYHVSFWYDSAYNIDRDSKPTLPDWVGEWSAYVYDDESDARAKPDLDAVHEPNDSAETSTRCRLQFPRVRASNMSPDRGVGSQATLTVFSVVQVLLLVLGNAETASAASPNPEDVLTWSIAAEGDPSRKAALLTMSLKGTAYEFCRTIPPMTLVHGGAINGHHVDPLTYIMHALAERFADLGEELRLTSITDLFNFGRQGNERIDELITRFDLIRQRSYDLGQLTMSVTGLAYILLKACEVSDAQLMQLLSPLQGRFPNDDQEFQILKTQLRRMGHILEHSPGNIAAALRGRNAQPQYFATEGSASNADAQPAYVAYGDTGYGWSERADTGWGYGGDNYANPGSHNGQDAHQAFLAELESDGATDSDTASSTGMTEVPTSTPEGWTDDASLQEHLFWAYSRAKATWRKFMGRPQRSVRRFTRRYISRQSGKGKGKRWTKGQPDEIPDQGPLAGFIFMAAPADQSARDTDSSWSHATDTDAWATYLRIIPKAMRKVLEDPQLPQSPCMPEPPKQAPPILVMDRRCQIVSIPAGPATAMVWTVPPPTLPAWSQMPIFGFLGPTRHHDPEHIPLVYGAPGTGSSGTSTLEGPMTITLEGMAAASTATTRRWMGEAPEITQALTSGTQSQLERAQSEQIDVFHQAQQVVQSRRAQHRNRHRRVIQVPDSWDHQEYDALDDSCALCQEVYLERDSVVRLVCRHLYHTACWTEYLMHPQARMSCPVCRGSARVVARFSYRADYETPAPSHNPTEQPSRAPSEESRNPATESAGARTPNRRPESYEMSTPPPANNDGENEAGGSPYNFEAFHSHHSFPWWPCNGNSSGNDGAPTAMIMHSTSHDDFQSILIDPGAYTNLAGLRWVRQLAQKCHDRGLDVVQHQLSSPMSIAGVGQGTQQCTWAVRLPIGVPAICEGEEHNARCSFEAPVVGGSGAGLPALLGLRSLRSKNAILVLSERDEDLKLIIPGPGGWEYQLSPGSVEHPLTTAPSGHLLLRCDLYEGVKVTSLNRPREAFMAGQSAKGTSLKETPREASSLTRAVQGVISSASEESEVQRAATLAISRRDFSHSTCLTLLQKTSFPASKQVRGVNQQAIPSQRLTLGLYAHGNQVGLTLNTDRFASLCRYVNLFLQASHPRVTWTSLHINNNMPVHPHRDHHNLRQSVNLTISLGAFTGGELWLEIAPEEANHNPSVHWLTQDDGNRIPGIVVDSHNKPVTFCPKLSHCVLPWKGHRFSVTAYTSRGLEHIPAHFVRALQKLNFPCVPFNQAVERPVGEPAQHHHAVERPVGEPAPHHHAVERPVGEPAQHHHAVERPAGEPAHQHEVEHHVGEPVQQLHQVTSGVSQVVAVVVEETPAVSLVLQQIGWRTVHFHPSHVNSAATASLSQRLKSMQVQALWLDLPIPGRHVHKDRLSSHMTQLCVWLRLCHELGLAAVLFGPYGRGWQAPSVQDLVDRGHVRKSYHRLCAWSFKVDVSQSEPSSTCFVAASVMQPLSGHPCACAVPQHQHKLDWVSERQPHQRRLRAQIHANVAVRVAQQWVTQQLRPSTPDNVHGSAARCAAARRLSPARVMTGEPSGMPFFLPPGPDHAHFPGFAASKPGDFDPLAAASATPVIPGFAPSKPGDADSRASASAAPVRRTYVPSQESDAALASRRAQAPDSHLSSSPEVTGTRVTVEDHHDDCGTSLASLSAYLPDEESVHSAHWVMYQHAYSLPPCWLLGSPTRQGLPSQPACCFLAESLKHALDTIRLWPAGDSEVNILSGGHDRQAVWHVRRRIGPGKYLSMVTLLDTNSEDISLGLRSYTLASRPLLCILLPTWHPTRPNPLTPLCEELANAQRRQARHYLCEQPWVSCPGHSPGWWQFLQKSHHCSAEVSDRHASYTFWASHAYLLRPLVAHPWHSQAILEPREWSNTLSTSVMDGITLLCAAEQLTQVYPSTAAGPDAESGDAPAEEPGDEWWRKCPGCRGRQSKHDDRHNRVPGQCKYPDAESLTWTCEGCRFHRPRGHPSHTMGPDCRHVIAEERKGAPRRGRHPRPPSRKAVDDPSRDLQAQLPQGADLGQQEEEEAAAESSRQPAAKASGSDDLPSDVDTEFYQPSDPDAAPAMPRARGPDKEPRVRRTYRDAGAGGEVPSDWSRFDISRSMRVLRVGNERAIRTELRKLHLRFWHASRQSLEQILKAAGVPQRILEYVPDIINTCQECRKWQRPGPSTQHTLTSSFKFNQQVEFDLLFYRTFIVCHLICRATRWHAGCAIPNKEGEAIYESICTNWVSIHGPMQQLIADGESGLWSEAVASRLKRQGVELKLRAPQQHARFIERRGAILRATLHVMEEQLEREGLVYTFPSLLAEAIFAGNALVHVGGSTPYQAVYGRQPAMLPPLEIPDMAESEQVGEAGDRQRSYIREAALQAMVQATSLARLNRAARTRTSPDSTREFSVGDLVDVFRKPSSKDASGWSGPYRVTESVPGQVQVQAAGHTRTYRSQDVRLTLLVLYSANQPSAWPECMQTVTDALLALLPGQSVLFGFANSPTGGLTLSKAARQAPQVLHALDFLFNNCWRLAETLGARLARGAKSLSAVSHASHSTLIWWRASVDEDVQFSSLQGTKVDLVELLGNSYSSSLVVQALHSADQEITLADACDEAADVNHELASEPALPGSDTEHQSVHTPQGPLSAISEGREEEEAFASFLATSITQPPEVAEALRVMFALSESETLEEASVAQELDYGPYFEPFDASTLTMPQPYAHYHAAQVAFSEHESFDYRDQAGNKCVELWFTRDMAKVVGDDSRLEPDQTYVLRMYAAGYRQAVIQRETDLLTPEDMRRHQPLVAAAALEELHTWNKYRCFKRVPRSTAHNVMDSKFVAKWKVVKDAQGKPQRIVRMRLALRGFKDLREGLENFAATGSRQSQRLLSSEVACHSGWKLVAVDVAKAFLQGMSYQEMSELTGEDEHEVHFDLPTREAEYLKQVPGFEGFDPRKETLRCLKPGTGCRDAPRAFALKLAQFTRSETIGLRPSLFDSELELKHVGSRLVLLLVKHVDDLKIAGEPCEVDALVAHLESGFGKLAYQENSFTVCGLTHVRHSDGSIEMNQDAYLAAMRPIQHPELTGRASNLPCTPAVHGLFQSLLGAVAYSMLSQAWAAVFVVALQRHAVAPTNLHVRRLNLLLAALQKLKAKLYFPTMTCDRKIVVFSDASFNKESEQKGYGMRGAVYLRMGTFNGQKRCHFLEAHSQSLKLVTRSTFAAETLAAVGAVDALAALLVTLQEMVCGTLSTEAARGLRESGSFVFDSELCIDAMNLYFALSAKYPKLPAEKALFIHIAWLRDFARVRVPSITSWVDTRDMLADGLTKGKVDRGALLEAMRGITKLMHPKTSTM